MKTALHDKYQAVSDAKTRLADTSKGAIRERIRASQKTDRDNNLKAIRDSRVAKKEEARKAIADKSAAKATATKSALDSFVVKEELSDYEAMQWLDENNFEPTMENVNFLREVLSEEVEPEVVEEVKVEEVIKEDESIKEMSSLFDLIDTINESIQAEVAKDLEAEHVEKTEEVEVVETKDAPKAEASVESGVEKAVEEEHAVEDKEVEVVETKDAPEAPKADESAVEKPLESDHVGEAKEAPEAVIVKEAVEDIPEPTEKDLKAIEAGDKHVGEYASGKEELTKEGHLKEEHEVEAIGEPEEKSLDIDAVIKTSEVAEMGTEESEEHIENVEDGKCECGKEECHCGPEAELNEYSEKEIKEMDTLLKKGKEIERDAATIKK
jgi:hypothetical protein